MSEYGVGEFWTWLAHIIDVEDYKYHALPLCVSRLGGIFVMNHGSTLKVYKVIIQPISMIILPLSPIPFMKQLPTLKA